MVADTPALCCNSSTSRLPNEGGAHGTSDGTHASLLLCVSSLCVREFRIREHNKELMTSISIFNANVIEKDFLSII